MKIERLTSLANIVRLMCHAITRISKQWGLDNPPWVVFAGTCRGYTIHWERKCAVKTPVNVGNNAEFQALDNVVV